MDDHTGDIFGRGRSGLVFRSRDEQGRDTVRKVFVGEAAAKVVQLALTGAPNAYTWCQKAIETAVLRRQILGELVEYWFGSNLRVAPAYGWSWNEQYQAYEMQCQFIDGRHAALHDPFTDGDADQARRLHRDVMKPLQRRLVESGFDGLVWQAGRGNPVALNNFLCEDSPQSSPSGFDRDRWVWIDLESGVPALFPLNPLELLRFYGPKSILHRRPLFDDVDLPKLRRYIEASELPLRECLGEQRFDQMAQRVDSLEQCQRQWKSLRRVDRNITYHLKKGRISQAQADWYAGHPLRWYVRQLPRDAARGAAKLSVLARGRLNWLVSLPYRRYVKNAWGFLSSQHYRNALARDYLAGRISQWQQRRQLTDDEAAYLSRHLDSDEASAYICDFGMHLALKPVAKGITYVLVPVLIALGLISGYWLAISIALTGATCRTLYTAGRTVQAALQGREKPWSALVAGSLPMVGNLAYPLQIAYCGTDRDHELARFILYDTFARFGQKVPIWGGCDTLTEHVLNRCPNRVIQSRPMRRSTPVGPVEVIVEQQS